MPSLEQHGEEKKIKNYFWFVSRCLSIKLYRVLDIAHLVSTLMPGVNNNEDLEKSHEKIKFYNSITYLNENSKFRRFVINNSVLVPWTTSVLTKKRCISNLVIEIIKYKNVTYFFLLDLDFNHLFNLKLSPCERSE